MKIVSENDYINAHQKGDKIFILERDKNGQRVIKEDDIEYHMYVLDEYGQHKTIFGDNCKEYVFNTRQDFMLAKKSFDPEKIYEDDVNNIFRYLSKNYSFDSVPNLKVAVFDIEVEFREDNRYSNADDAENRIISVAVKHKWDGTKYCIFIAPDEMPMDKATTYAKELEQEYENVHVIHAKTESELIRILSATLIDCDVFTGWNSESYDVKYVFNRTRKLMGDEGLRMFSPVNGLPRETKGYNEKTRKHFTIYEPSGLVHLDYMNLYKKYTFGELTSYSLDNVANVELGDQKIEYEGMLYNLYLRDLKEFLRYNIKDVELVSALDDKLRLIDLTNVLAHSNGVLMQTTLGTVALTEQAIINEGHYYQDEYVVFPSKKKEESIEYDEEGNEVETAVEDDSGAAGAFVVDPKKGLRKGVAGFDVTSLYPSVIRSLNMSPETLVAQIDITGTEDVIKNSMINEEADSFAEAWHRFFNVLEFDEVINKTDNKIVLHFNRMDKSIELTGKEMYQFIYGSDEFCLSANGTVFSRKKQGIIPALLTRWFRERKELQKLKGEWADKLDLAKTEEEIEECTYWVKFYDQRQHAKKINLNALYGALLNKHCRFYDKRLGQSTTLTGRSITRHMGSKINEIVCGQYDITGDAVIYGDTDSIYFSVEEVYRKMGMEWNLTKEETLELYNGISKTVNATFPEFMDTRFNVGLERGGYIKADRENLSDYSLFIRKKRYVMRLFEADGHRLDTNGKKGKMKYMGIEVKRSDTPKIVQDALIHGIEALLDGKSEKEVMDILVGYKNEFVKLDPWELGRPSGANAVSYYTGLYHQHLKGQIGKPTIPGAIAGAIHFNQILDDLGDIETPKIGDGSKVYNCKLLPNNSGFTSISFSTDLVSLPEWAKALPYNMDDTIEGIYNKKVDNIFLAAGFDTKVLRARASFHDNFEDDEY